MNRPIYLTLNGAGVVYAAMPLQSNQVPVISAIADPNVGLDVTIYLTNIKPTGSPLTVPAGAERVWHPRMEAGDSRELNLSPDGFVVSGTGYVVVSFADGGADHEVLIYVK